MSDATAHPSSRSAAWLTCLIVLLTGCTTWRVQAAPPATVLAAGKPARVRVLRIDGTRLDLTRATIQADSVTGTDSSGQRQAVALADVRALALRQPREGRIIATMVLGMALTVAVICDHSEHCGGGGGW